MSDSPESVEAPSRSEPVSAESGHTASAEDEVAQPGPSHSDGGDSDVDGPTAASTQASEPASSVEPTTAELADVLANLNSQIANFHERAAAQEVLIAKMHARIELLQSGETKKLLKPVSTQLIALYSDLEDAAAALSPGISVEQIGGLLSNFALMVEQILDNLGLTSLETAAGDDFEPRMHHAIKKVDTGNPASDRKIVEVLRQGFIEPGEAKPLAPSRVSVYRYDGANAEATPIAHTGEQ
ncbi:nucleotide exchange factor GrpE [Mycolicibacterium tusciae]|uniref:nucleotide exchange factor GrpE n=1 Tax=Mycolicibacterium tusciae TaxID=75922 RepID=UPI0023519A14|nr:nucleotide exchange factor GrpE [Mycolicibacterium tusciae]